MKNLFLFLIIALNTTCVSSNMATQELKLKDMIRAGEDVFIENQTFSEDIDFTKMLKPNLISEGIYQVRIISSITFKNCTFKGKVIAYSRDENKTVLCNFQSNLGFIGCTFNNDASFRAASIFGRADFTETSFLKTSNFEECTFFENAYFRKSIFHEELRFQNAFFMQKANFLDAQFDNTASFQGSTFNAEAQFTDCKFGGYADFTLIKWNQNCFFNYAEFLDRAFFSSADYRANADFNSVKFQYAEISNSRFYGNVRFMKSTAEKMLKLENDFFLFSVPDFSSFDKEKLSVTGVTSIH